MNFVFLAGFILLLNNVHLSVQDQGSTPRLKEIVTGRCYDFQNKKVGSDSSEWKDCKDIWEAFYGGFAYKDPCKLTQDDYKPFFEKAGMPEMHDQVRDWGLVERLELLMQRSLRTLVHSACLVIYVQYLAALQC